MSDSARSLRRHRRWIIALIKGLAVAIFLAVSAMIILPVAFIGIQCYGNGEVHPAEPAEAIRDIADYARPESYTYLTLPEWMIVYSADDYARFISTAPP